MAKKKKPKKKPSKHFLGTGGCNIHTFRENTCHRSCNYKTVKQGTYAYDPNQAHHIVPCSATVAYKELPAYASIVKKMDDIYYDTDYCVSQEHNIMLLPLKTAYTRKVNNRQPGPGGGMVRTAAGGAPVWSSDLPCHNWSHPAYTKEVVDELNKKVWKPMAQAVANNACPPPTFFPNKFASVETTFTRRLKRRGKRAGGTQSAIKNAAKKPRWWFAFSMATSEFAAAEPAVSFGSDAGVPKSLIRIK